MKFKDAYRRANDTVHVRESLQQQIQNAYDRERTKAPQSRENRRRWLVAIPTAVAAAAAAFVAVTVGLNAVRTKNAAPQADTMVAAGYYEAVAQAQEPPEAVQSAEETLRAVDSYDVLCEILNRNNQTARYGGLGYPSDMKNGSIAPDAVPVTEEIEEVTLTTGDGSETVSHSGTNNQVETVDEADLVKTDGTWIYDLNTQKNKLYILKADGKGTAVQVVHKFVNETKNKSYRYCEMILANDRLYVIAVVDDWDAATSKDMATTVTEVYALNDRTAIKRVATFRQDGEYRTARLVGNTLVTVSDYGVYETTTVENIYRWCPGVVCDGETKTLRPQDIYLNPSSNQSSFAVVTAINTETDVRYESQCAVLGGCEAVYCNDTNLLIASPEWVYETSDEQTDAEGKHYVEQTNRSCTSLCLFSIADGKVEPIANGRIDGRLLNQFSMDANRGTYRFVVTRSMSKETIHTDGVDRYDWSSQEDCALYVLDEGLQPLGAIDGLAENELVQSARFMGDVVYFVTFRQTDPLFAVDLKDPAAPKILSELKITGFSAYLHPFGEGKLLGIGYEADETTGRTTGVKVSVYDISDPANVTETLRQTLQADYTNVAFNHKSVYVDAETGTFAFPAENQYFVLRVTEEGVKRLGTIDTGDFAWDGSVRGLSIDKDFYIVSPDAVTVLSFETMAKLAKVKLK